MNTLRQAIHEYLALRRGLGFKLREAGNGLLDFAGFMERHHASYITEELAVAWAQQSSERPASSVGGPAGLHTGIRPPSQRD